MDITATKKYVNKSKLQAKVKFSTFSVVVFLILFLFSIIKQISTRTFLLVIHWLLIVERLIVFSPPPNLFVSTALLSAYRISNHFPILLFIFMQFSFSIGTRWARAMYSEPTLLEKECGEVPICILNRVLPMF